MISTFDYAEIAAMIDHTLLDPTIKDLELEEGCELAVRYGVASVFVPPYYVARCARLLAVSGKHAGTTIGFPHGSHTTAVKLTELAQGLRDGAEELDAVVNINKVRSGDWFYVENELRRLADAAHVAGAKITVTFENACIDECDKIRLCEICGDIRADWIKTSTGYATGGALEDDLHLMRTYSPAHVQLKVTGDVDTLDRVIAMRDLGVNRVGTSRTRDILDECRRRLCLEPVVMPELAAAAG